MFSTGSLCDSFIFHHPVLIYVFFSFIIVWVWVDVLFPWRVVLVFTVIILAIKVSFKVFIFCLWAWFSWVACWWCSCAFNSFVSGLRSQLRPVSARCSVFLAWFRSAISTGCSSVPPAVCSFPQHYLSTHPFHSVSFPAGLWTSPTLLIFTGHFRVVIWAVVRESWVPW